jgi:hypothetical protein
MCYQKCLNFAVLKVLPSGIVIVLDLAVWGDVVGFVSEATSLRQIRCCASDFVLVLSGTCF